jgi:hypothetical protein
MPKKSLSKRRPHTRPYNVPYVPSEKDREYVAAMAGVHMTADSIRRAIDHRMSKTTFYKAFRDELKTGSARIHGKVADKLMKAIDEGKPWAIQGALRNLPQFRWDQYGKVIPHTPDIDIDNDFVRINFVTPSRKPEPVDVSPYAGQAADLSRTAIEPPRDRTHTDFGVYEAPRSDGPSYQSQTGEPPPSIFDQGSSKGWMK